MRTFTLVWFLTSLILSLVTSSIIHGEGGSVRRDSLHRDEVVIPASVGEESRNGFIKVEQAVRKRYQVSHYYNATASTVTTSPRRYSTISSTTSGSFHISTTSVVSSFAGSSTPKSLASHVTPVTSSSLRNLTSPSSNRIYPLSTGSSTSGYGGRNHNSNNGVLRPNPAEDTRGQRPVHGNAQNSTSGTLHHGSGHFNATTPSDEGCGASPRLAGIWRLGPGINRPINHKDGKTASVTLHPECTNESTSSAQNGRTGLSSHSRNDTIHNVSANASQNSIASGDFLAPCPSIP